MAEDDEKRLKNDDIALWKAMTGDVKRLPGQDYQAAAPAQDPEAGPKPDIKETPIFKKQPDKPAQSTAQSLDTRTAERLRRGQMKIDARLDLHGLNQDEAYDALYAFISHAYQAGHRCVLVITGKGRGGRKHSETWLDDTPGLLRQRLPAWLAQPHFAQMVLKVQSAKPRDGGDGASYVLLRRARAFN